jgi:hypothetical protein
VNTYDYNKFPIVGKTGKNLSGRAIDISKCLNLAVVDVDINKKLDYSI